ncbi:hypothetical protein BUALT_Bualt16G0015400 [Buddleja alternifolia]|uniref:DUF1421 domain-containing protein n=1 Tax=Buddleja alternifolia TaxID=168488 RepID=A0AAV6W9Z8_9LAMI|nr:hypothetical protein BUALT_Bualt16G0015400 [Buddleja alternifolia]
MNNSATSQFMDKQIMDLSNSHSDFIDFMNRPSEKKDDIVASYDFMPIRAAFGSSSSPPPLTRPSDFDSGAYDAPIRPWNSFDSKIDVALIRNYDSLDADEPAKLVLGKNQKPANASLDASLVSEIDGTMKKYADNLIFAIDGLSARVSQLETRTRNLENSVDDMKVSLGNNHGSIEGKMMQMENILREVQTGVQVIRDKQEVVEAQLQMAKLQLPKVEQDVRIQHTPYGDSAQLAHQQFSTISQAPASLPSPNAPPPPPHQLPNQFPQNPPPGQNPENPNPQYQIPPPRQHNPPPNAPPPPPPHQLPIQFPQNLPPGQTPENPNLQYQIPPPYQHHPPPQNQYSSTPSSQPHPSFSSLNPSPPQQAAHHPEETPYTSPQVYPPTILPPSSQQLYAPTQNVYDFPSSRPGPEYPGPFGPTGHGEPYPYSSGFHVKPHQPSSPTMGQIGGNGYSHLPTARLLPQAPPTGGGGSGSGGAGNRVPIDDVVDKVTNMGFPRDHVRSTVRKLTENGQAVDLNIVLDKLMNDGEGRVWFGQ